MTNSKGLTLKAFCATVERFHFKYGTLPTRSEFEGEYGVELSQEKWEAYTTHDEFHKYCSIRNLTTTRYATPEMIQIADAILDTTIPSLPLKLKSVGLTIKDYNKVKNNQTFLAVLRERTNRLPERERSSVFASLVRRANDGNVGAAKLWLELTGEYTPSTKGTLEIATTSQREIVGALLEVLQRHVSPEKLMAIANDFEAVLLNQGADSKALLPKPRALEPDFDI